MVRLEADLFASIASPTSLRLHFRLGQVQTLNGLHKGQCLESVTLCFTAIALVFLESFEFLSVLLLLFLVDVAGPTLDAGIAKQGTQADR